MEFNFHCPNCNRALHVPTNASGHHARCPACQGVFVVPNARDLAEETFSRWIAEDQDQAMKDEFAQGQVKADETEPAPAAPQQPRPQAKAQTPPPPRTGAPPGARVPAGPTGGEGPKEPDARPPARTSRESAAQEAPPDRQSKEAPPAPQASDPPRSPAAPKPPATVAAKAKPAPATARPPSDPSLTSRQIQTGSSAPRLAVLESSSNGVRLAFDSVWFDHTGFRASMPMRCAIAGCEGTQKLRVRPLAFVDRCKSTTPTASQIEQAHEHIVRPGHTPRALVAILGKIDDMEKPFNLAMPYYVCANCTNESLHCHTHYRDDGGITCDVMIPSGIVALEWLGRVNGVCGKDHEILEAEVSLMYSDAWRDLPDLTRKRLEGWCTFEPGERFNFYINDADFGERDAGLAGLVVTNRRCIAHKYHHRAEVIRSEHGRLLVRFENNFALLTLQTHNHHTRMGKYRRHDVEKLRAELDEDSGLTVEEQSS